MNCGTFDAIRQPLLERIGEIEGFDRLDENEKFIFLLSNPDAGNDVSKFLNKALQIRNFLLEGYKQNG